MKENKPTPKPRVRQRGDVRQLDIGGMLASAYRPGSLLAGSVWDALAAPLALLPHDERRSVLMLGLGGASVARVMRAMAPRMEIVSVEIDPDVVSLAREQFDLDALDVHVVIEDARHFLERESRRYDIVMEDIFVEGSLVKPEWIPEPGFTFAAGCLQPGGLLISNSVHETAGSSITMQALLDHGVHMELRDCENTVLVASNRQLSARALRRAVVQEPLVANVLRNVRVRTAWARGLEGQPR